MKSNFYKEYSEEVFNREENFEKIMLNYKNKKRKYKKLLNIAAIILVIFTLGFITPELYAKIKYDIEFKEYNLRKYEVINGAISDKLEDGYLEKVDMNYLEQDKIKIKVNSMLITDDHFQTDINFEFEEGVIVDSERFSYSFIIYDEEKNVYGTYLNTKDFYDSKAHANTIRNFCRDVGIKFDLFEGVHAISTYLGVGSISAENRNITSQIEMSATKEHYPKSKKIYIRIFDLGYIADLNEEERKNTEFTDEFVELSDAEWIFEIDVPEKFYNRETIYLKLAEEITEIEFNKIELTEVGLVIAGRYSEITELFEAGLGLNPEESQKWYQEVADFVYITDGDGNRYDSISTGSGDGKNSFLCRYLVGKKMLNKKLYLNYTINGVLTTVELVQE